MGVCRSHDSSKIIVVVACSSYHDLSPFVIIQVVGGDPGHPGAGAGGDQLPRHVSRQPPYHPTTPSLFLHTTDNQSILIPTNTTHITNSAVTSVVQAAAAADAGASYIAPYVGRVTDWKGPEGEGEDGEMGVERGVRLARDCQFLYRAKGCGTKVRKEG